MRLSSSRIATIATGVSKNWASCHPMKPVSQPPSKRPPELQNRVQTIRAGTQLICASVAGFYALLHDGAYYLGKLARRFHPQCMPRTHAHTPRTLNPLTYPPPL